MKKIKHFTTTLICLLGFSMGFSQNPPEVTTKKNQNPTQNKANMKTYLIEREIQDAGNLTPEQLKGIAQKSNEVVSEMGNTIQWVNSYVTENKVYCVYRAENKELLREHAKKGGFPANKISEFSTIIDPTTAKE